MKRDLSYAAAFFLAFSAYLLLSLVTELAAGVEKWSDAPGYLLIVIGIPAIVSVLVFVVINLVRRRFWKASAQAASFKLTKHFVVIASLAIGLSAASGVWVGYSAAQEKLAAKQAARQQAEAVKRAQEAERERLTAMTPQQRAEEELRKQNEAQAAAQKAAEAAAKQKAATLAKAREEEKHNARQLMALIGAKDLEQSMKDPESFKLRSVYLMRDGTVCYGYRAKNSFGAELPGSAVLFVEKKRPTMLVQEQNGNRFVAAWNRRCANKSGEDLTAGINYAIHH